MNGRRSLVASQPSIWHSLSPTYGSVHTSLKLSLYEYLAKWTLAILAGFSCTNLLLHLLHLHLASLIVGLVEPKLGLGASQLVLCFLKLVLQLRVLHGTVDPQGSEPVHLRGRLPLVSKISRPLQLNVHPEISMFFTCFLSWKSSSQKNVSKQTQVLFVAASKWVQHRDRTISLYGFHMRLLPWEADNWAGELKIS